MFLQRKNSIEFYFDLNKDSFAAHDPAVRVSMTFILTKQRPEVVELLHRGRTWRISGTGGISRGRVEAV